MHDQEQQRLVDETLREAKDQNRPDRKACEQLQGQLDTFQSDQTRLQRQLATSKKNTKRFYKRIIFNPLNENNKDSIPIMDCIRAC